VLLKLPYQIAPKIPISMRHEQDHKPLDNLSCQWAVVQPSSNGFRFIYQTQPEVQQVLHRPASFSVYTRPKYA